MSELAEKLITENLQTKNPTLDLGRCDLEGAEDSLFKSLQNTTHLQSLILSDYHWSFDSQKQIYVGNETQNRGKRNYLLQIPKYLPKSLKKLTLNGDTDFNEIPTKIQDYSPLLELENLEHLEVDYQENLDLTIISQLTQLKTLTCFWQGEFKDIHLLANLSQLTFLDISHTEIENVDFIKKMTSLEHLFLTDDYIENLDVLANLKSLQTLLLAYNDVLQDIGFLKNLKHLRKLSLQNCEQSDLSVLKHLKQLQYLNLAWNQLDDIDFLTDLTHLEELDLSENQIQNVEPLKALTKLKQLDLAFNELYNLEPLQNLTQLEELDVKANANPGIKNLNFLQNLTQLKKLDLEQTSSQDLENLKHLKNLEELRLDTNFLESLDNLPALDNLKNLSIKQNKIQEASTIGKLKNLESLDISYNPIENIDFVQNLAKLKIFVAWWGNKIRDISALSHCQYLETLRIGRGFVTLKADALKNLTNLKSLSLYQIGLQDISFLQNLKNLTNLNLQKNNIKDISPIASLQHLVFLGLEGNPIQDVRPLKNLPFIFDFKIDNQKLKTPPIWYAYGKWQRKKFSDYIHLSELPYVEKIWQLMISEEEANQKLAIELAKGQGWTEEQIKVYQNLLEN